MDSILIKTHPGPWRVKSEFGAPECHVVDFHGRTVVMLPGPSSIKQDALARWIAAHGPEDS